MNPTKRETKRILSRLHAAAVRRHAASRLTLLLGFLGSLLSFAIGACAAAVLR